jgi:hypothetical protein
MDIFHQHVCTGYAIRYLPELSAIQDWTPMHMQQSFRRSLVARRPPITVKKSTRALPLPAKHLGTPQICQTSSAAVVLEYQL